MLLLVKQNNIMIEGGGRLEKSCIFLQVENLLKQNVLKLLGLNFEECFYPARFFKAKVEI